MNEELDLPKSIAEKFEKAGIMFVMGNNALAMQAVRRAIMAMDKIQIDSMVAAFQKAEMAAQSVKRAMESTRLLLKDIYIPEQNVRIKKKKLEHREDWKHRQKFHRRKL